MNPDEIEQFVTETVGTIRKQCQEAGTDKIGIALRGDLYSSVTTALCSMAVGRESVLGVDLTPVAATSSRSEMVSSIEKDYVNSVGKHLKIKVICIQSTGARERISTRVRTAFEAVQIVYPPMWELDAEHGKRFDDVHEHYLSKAVLSHALVCWARENKGGIFDASLEYGDWLGLTIEEIVALGKAFAIPEGYPTDEEGHPINTWNNEWTTKRFHRHRLLRSSPSAN